MAENGKKPVCYSIDAGRSRFTVQAFAGGLLSAFGHNPTLAIRKFTGEVGFMPDTLEEASLSFKIKADSLEVDYDTSEKDRREIERLTREEVLEPDKYPEIVFESETISAEKIFEGHYRVKIKGILKMHGVARDVSIWVQVSLSEDRLRAQGSSSLRQSDYGIKLIYALGGTIKVKDELKFSFDILAAREYGR